MAKPTKEIAVRKPLLDLDTLTQRERITIDGKPYQIRNPGELDIVQFHAITAGAETVQQLLTGDASKPGFISDLSEEAVVQVAAALDTVCRAIFVDVPADVYARLSETQKLQVMRAFSSLQEGRAPKPPAGTKTETGTTTDLPTGER